MEFSQDIISQIQIMFCSANQEMTQEQSDKSKLMRQLCRQDQSIAGSGYSSDVGLFVAGGEQVPVRPPVEFRSAAKHHRDDHPQGKHETNHPFYQPRVYKGEDEDGEDHPQQQEQHKSLHSQPVVCWNAFISVEQVLAGPSPGIAV